MGFGDAMQRALGVTDEPADLCETLGPLFPSTKLDGVWHAEYQSSDHAASGALVLMGRQLSFVEAPCLQGAGREGEYEVRDLSRLGKGDGQLTIGVSERHGVYRLSYADPVAGTIRVVGRPTGLGPLLRFFGQETAEKLVAEVV